MDGHDLGRLSLYRGVRTCSSVNACACPLSHNHCIPTWWVKDWRCRYDHFFVRHSFFLVARSDVSSLLTSSLSCLPFSLSCCTSRRLDGTRSRSRAPPRGGSWTLIPATEHARIGSVVAICCIVLSWSMYYLLRTPEPLSAFCPPPPGPFRISRGSRKQQEPLSELTALVVNSHSVLSACYVSQSARRCRLDWDLDCRGS